MIGQKSSVWRLIFGLMVFSFFIHFGNRAIRAEDVVTDFVLVLDSSGSMENSDEQQLHISAAKMFVDMLPSENARLSVIGFGPNYGAEAYPMDVPQNDGIAGSSEKDNQDARIKVFYPLSSVSDQESKQDAKSGSGLSCGIKEADKRGCFE